MNKSARPWRWVLLGWVLWLSLGGLVHGATPPPEQILDSPEDAVTVDEAPPLFQAFEAAIATANLAQAASTPDDWSAVTTGWATAIQSLQAVPPDSPQWVFAQRKAREYLENQAIAQQLAEEAGAPIVFPSLGSDVLDEQIGVYLSYIATFGPPDVMVMGSSRALQGINPQILQQQLAQQDLESVRVYTFAVNGATAQVMNFILQDLLTPDQLPRMLIWAGGSRSFNSARVDRTFAKILDSPGYAALQGGDRPAMGWVDGETVAESEKAVPMPVTAINGYGFLPVAEVFDPETYYQTHPRVSGRHDASYQPFDLEGVQTVALRAIATFTRDHAIPLIFVNLPLSSDYLDDTRLPYEQEFQAFLEREAVLGDFIVVDLLQQWPTQNQFFADPSHLNQIGAAQVAMALAEHPQIPWKFLASDIPEATEDSERSNTEGEEP